MPGFHPIRALRSLWRLIADFEMYPTCPICGAVYYIKAMPLHLSGHRPDDPDVIAWRAREQA